MKFWNGIWLMGLSIGLFPVQGGAQSSASSEAPIEEIFVTGIRASLDRAQEIKRDADAVVDAITVEDLGKFSDESVADALQRIPGVQINRNVGGQTGDQASVRGLGPQFVVGTINGRTPLSSGTEGRVGLRSFNFDVLPSEVAHRITVHKSPTASLADSGLGGTVNIETLRPLEVNYEDGRNLFASFQGRTEVNEIIGDYGPLLSGVFGAKNDDDTVGAFVTLHYGDVDTGRDQQNIRFGGSDIILDNNGNGVRDDGDTTLTGVQVLQQLDNAPIRDEHERLSVAGGLQFQPNNEWDIHADLEFARFDNFSFRDSTLVAGGRNLGGDVVWAPDSIAIDPDFNEVRFIDFGGARRNGEPISANNPFADGRVPGYRPRNQRFDNLTDTFIAGLNAEWNRGRLTVTGDGYYNQLEFRQILSDIELRAVPAPSSGDIGFDTRTGGAVREIVGSEITDPSFFAGTGRRGRTWHRTTDGDQIGFSLDLDYEIESDLVESVEFGARYTMSDLDVIQSDRVGWDLAAGSAEAAGFAAAAISGDTVDFLDALTFPSINYKAGSDYLDSLGITATSGASTPGCTTQTFGEENQLGRFEPDLTDKCPRLDSTYGMKEDTLALYGEVNFLTEMGDIPIIGNFGLRAVNTDNASYGYQQSRLSSGTVLTLVENSNSYWEVLPSVNVKLELTDDVNLRLSVAKLMSRPDFIDMSPRSTVNYDSFDVPISVSTGNPDLNPYTTWSFDMTLEWYNSYDGAFVASVFRKDVSAFILGQTVDKSVDIVGFGTLTLPVQTPVNFSDGEVFGAELGFNQPFSFLPSPWDGLGMVANYTRVDSSFDDDVGDGGFGFPGASEDNVNILAYYEKYGFGLRVGYVYRGDHFLSLSGDQTGVPNFVEPTEQLNVNVSYQLTDNIELTAQAINLTEEPQREFTVDSANPRRYFSTTQRFILGMRAIF